MQYGTAYTRTYASKIPGHIYYNLNMIVRTNTNHSVITLMLTIPTIHIGSVAPRLCIKHYARSSVRYGSLPRYSPGSHPTAALQTSLYGTMATSHILFD